MTKRLTDAEILAQIPAARARGKAVKAAGLLATSARYDRTHQRIVLELQSGYLLGVPVSALPHLADATPAQLAAVELSPQGGALRIPAVDADYSVPGLVMAMTAREIGRQGGRAKSTVKANASRLNGAKGGRPRRPYTPVGVVHVGESGRLFYAERPLSAGKLAAAKKRAAVAATTKRAEGAASTRSGGGGRKKPAGG